MHIFVGTSGWYYQWNPDGFDWYVQKSGLNTVELNTSFYRFPFPNQVKSWARKTPRHFRWSVKVNRLITHVFQLGERAFSSWEKFRKLFEPLDEKVDFYLFQLPPNHSERTRPKIERFFERTRLGGRFALEPRHPSWFNDESEGWARDLGLTLVSVDSPDYEWIFKSGDSVYLRMHGRSAWYSHCYSRKELEGVKASILSKKPKSAYVYFNNDHDMLGNAREFLDMF